MEDIVVSGVTPAGKAVAIQVDENGVVATSGGGGGGGGNVVVTSSVLPTGASTSTLQTTGNTSLGNIDTKTPALVSGKVPVTDPTALPLPTGASTSANQTSTNTKLDTIHNDLIAALPVGSNVIGKVGIDQTTPGSTNKVSIGSDGQVATNGTVFIFSTTNSSTSQLGAGATFTGAVESIVNQQSFSILFTSDQNATITINQFIDGAGTKNAQQLVFTYTAGSKFARSGVANGNYFQIIVQNTGGSTTTTLQLDTAYGTIPSATQLNNSPMALMEVNGTALSLGQTTKSASIPVTLPSDIGTLVVSSAGIPTSLGQQASSASQPVTLSNENVQDLYFTGQAAQTALVNNIIPAAVSANATDLTGYRSASVQIICPAGTYTTGAIIFEGSNDNSNFVTIPVWNQLLLTGAPLTAAITLATTTFIVYTFPVTTRYVRVRISTAVSGASASVQAISKFSQTSWTNPVTQVAQATGANLNAAISSLPTLATVTTVATVTALANGQTAHSSASTGSPLRVAGRVVPTTIATVDATLVAGDASDAGITSGQQLITKNFGTSELDINVAVTPTVTSTSIQGLVAASGTASVRNYITQLTIASDTLGAAGNMFILDNQGAIGTSVTIATPGVFTSTAHDLKIGDTIIFTSLGTITGVSVNTLYYVTATSFAATTFTVALTPGGTALQITGSTSAFTFYRVLQLVRMQTAALANPIVITPPNPLRGIANSNLNVYFPVSLTSGTIYINVIGYRGF